jgi:hypothetical protein
MPNLTLDRERRVDLRSLDFPVVPAGTSDAALIKDMRSVDLSFDVSVLDQGSEGSCVGHGTAHSLMADPIRHDWMTHDLAVHIYHGAQRRDQYTGENYEGSSVLGGCQYLVDAGLVNEFRWALNAVQVAYSIGRLRRAVIQGVDWYTGMFDADANGFIRPTGRIEGGHCTAVDQVHVMRSSGGGLDWVNTWVGGPNSWGPDWGYHGHWKMSLIDYAKLIPGGDFACFWGEKRASTADNILRTN